MEDIKISFCKCNDEGYEQVIAILKEKHSEIKLSENKCIGVCNKCGSTLIARINGQLIEGETVNALYAQIIEYIK